MKPPMFTREDRSELKHQFSMFLIKQDLHDLMSKEKCYNNEKYFDSVAKRCQNNEYDSDAEEWVKGVEGMKFADPGRHDMIYANINPDWIIWRREQLSGVR